MLYTCFCEEGSKLLQSTRGVNYAKNVPYHGYFMFTRVGKFLSDQVYFKIKNKIK